TVLVAIPEERPAQRTHRSEERRDQVEVAVVSDAAAEARERTDAVGIAEGPEAREPEPMGAALPVVARDRIASVPPRADLAGILVSEVVLGLVRAVEGSDVVGVLQNVDRLPRQHLLLVIRRLRWLRRRRLLRARGGGGQAQHQAGQDRRRLHRPHGLATSSGPSTRIRYSIRRGAMAGL